MNIVYVHGVPDTPHIWDPLVKSLGQTQINHIQLALPGFTRDLDAPSKVDKEFYLNWLLAEVQFLKKKYGPVHLIGHDWGAILVLKLAQKKPELIERWAVSGGLIDAKFNWHILAKIWQTPLLGELQILSTKKSDLKKILIKFGVPEEIAEIDSQNWFWKKKKCILQLYRSAVDLALDWDVMSGSNSSDADWARKGAIIWGVKDPFYPVSLARDFSAKMQIPIFEVAGGGHWAIAQDPNAVAVVLRRHWQVQ